MRQKYSPQEVARLGGLTAAHNMTPEQRSERARKGGEAVMAKYGRAHMLRLRLNQRREAPAATCRGDGATAARVAHNHEEEGSTPFPATKV